MKIKFLMIGLITVIILFGCNSTGVKSGDASQAAAAIPVSGEPIKVAMLIPFDQTTQVPHAVKSECALGNKLSDFIHSYGREYSSNVVKVGKIDGEQGKVLDVKITNVHGTAGGAWSGAKSVAIEGKLTENGKVIGTFRGSRYSGGGAFGGFKGTCAILGRCVKALGRDVAQWLQSPVMNARLGDG
jgi:hypothetical protein